MAAALVTGQHAVAQSSTAVASISASLPGAATAGNMVAASVNTFQHTISSTGVTDNQGNGTYAQDAVAVGTSNTSSAIHSKQNIAASGTFTVTMTWGASVLGTLIIGEFSGVASSLALDTHAAATPSSAGGTGNLTWTGPSTGVMAATGDLVLAATNPIGNVATEGLSQTTAGYATVGSEQDGSQFDCAILSWQAAPSTTSVGSTYKDTGSTSGTLPPAIPCVIASYKAAAGGTTVTAPAGAVTLGANAPTLAYDGTVTSPAGAIVLGAAAATVTTGTVVTAPAGAVVAGGDGATISSGITVTAPVGSITLAGDTYTLAASSTQTAPAGLLTLGGDAASVVGAQQTEILTRTLMRMGL